MEDENGNLKERQVFDSKWTNTRFVPYFSSVRLEYYAKDVYDLTVPKKSYSKTLRELRRKIDRLH